MGWRMEPRAFVYRALGVPHILRDENKPSSAAATLVRLADLPAGTAEAPRTHPGGLEGDARRVVEALVGTLERGGFDPMIGGYQGPPTKGPLPLQVPDQVRTGGVYSEATVEKMVEVGVEAVLAYAKKHPFFD